MSYGVDVWCGQELQTGRLASGAMVVLLACLRRQITPRGVLRGGEEEQVYGLDLASYVGQVGEELAIPSLPGRIRAELLKDDRVAAVEATVTASTNAAGETELLIEEQIKFHEFDETFPLTLKVDAVSIQVLGIGGS